MAKTSVYLTWTKFLTFENLRLLLYRLCFRLISSVVKLSVILQLFIKNQITHLPKIIKPFDLSKNPEKLGYY